MRGMALTLRDQGFGFYASPSRQQYRWMHPTDKAMFYGDWIDCTDMNDDEFAAFVEGA